MQEPPKNEPPEERVIRVIDFRIPLPWLLGVAGAVGWTLVSMYFSVGQLVKTVDDLQITVKSGNTSVSVLASEVGLLKFRMGTTEDDLKRINEMMRNAPGKAAK